MFAWLRRIFCCSRKPPSQEKAYYRYYIEHRLEIMRAHVQALLADRAVAAENDFFDNFGNPPNAEVVSHHLEEFLDGSENADGDESSLTPLCPYD